MFGYADIRCPTPRRISSSPSPARYFPIVRLSLRRFAPPDASSIEVPLWITTADVKRAATAGGTVEGAMLTASDIPEGATLDENARSPVCGSGLSPTTNACRSRSRKHRPVCAGTSAWSSPASTPSRRTSSVRLTTAGRCVPGVVKVVDTAHDMPAGTIDSINDFVFAYQGRRIHACLDVRRARSSTRTTRSTSGPKSAGSAGSRTATSAAGHSSCAFTTARRR